MSNEIAGSTSLALETVPKQYTQPLAFNGDIISVTSAPAGYTLDVSEAVRDLSDYHGDPFKVDHVVDFGAAMLSLAGTYQGEMLEDPDTWPDQGIIVLSNYYREAEKLVADVDTLANKIIETPDLYNDKSFCRDYFELAKAGYGMLRKYLPDFRDGAMNGRPVSLERAGLVTTRLDLEVSPDEVIPDEVRVITKRSHLKYNDPTDLMVTVSWRDPDRLAEIDDQPITVADFVNPASWASTGAFLVAAQSRDVKPSALVHHSIMATSQGIEFAKRVTKSRDFGQIATLFCSVGISETMNEHFYLVNPAVADAGHALRHFLPTWYKP
ncbi:MAG TPA: hypothetical protein VMQ52_00025 [Candidatus Saccharimonadales bacterium]|jgi:hypothetical protein|nr:hypothetical protein [Candidatus Saccharimonadales bacterium]